MESEQIYSQRVADVYKSLETSPEGLTASEVETRRSLFGDNILSEPPKAPAWRKFIVHILHPMTLLLIGAGVIAFITQRIDLAIVIWIIVLINASFSFWREYRTEQALSALHHLLPTYARLIRNNEEISMPASELVPGDLLVLAEGDNIPADARVVEEFGLRTNNATLTGEAMPARKSADASLREGISELERPNLVFAGTSVVSGTGRAVVYATGMLTEFGRIARLTQQVKEEPSPLQRELIKITRVLAIVAVGLGALVFSIGTSNLGLKPFNAFLLGVGTIVAVLPEGLTVIVTLSLATSGQRLANKGVLVKKLATIEALGNISIIATDKSGTLTQNQMTVREIWVGGKHLSVSGNGYEPKGEFSPNPVGKEFEPDLRALLEASALSNNSRILPPSREKPGWTTLGDQTEAALKVAAFKLGYEDKGLNERYPRVHELPFDARRKRMSTIHSMSDDQNRSDTTEIAFIKGAPREVLQLCTHIQMGGQEVELDDDLREQILNANDEFSRNALRVLALARRQLPVRSKRERSGGPYYSIEHIERSLTFLGLMAMLDPPRTEVSRAVKILYEAGIRIVMITGDYGLTAESLARRVGLLTTPNPIILTGSELDQLNDEELQNIVKQEVIFARMAPENKLRLVAAFQSQGHIVAVTGDGVNDAPALRKADVGISMGIIGTDIAKEAADIILTKDNFASIASAIAEGRAVYDNLRKFITYIFSSNVPEILPFLVTALTSINFFWTVLQILAIDLGTDITPALALGTEKPEPSVMRRPPRPRGKPIIDRGLLIRSFLWLGLIEAVLCYSGIIALYGFSGNIALLDIPALTQIPFPQLLQVSIVELPILASTVFFAGVVTSQIGNAFACRTERARGRWLGWTSNKILLYGIGGEILIALFLIYSPVNQFFDLTPLPANYWLWLILYAPILYSLDWLRKGILRRRARAQNRAGSVKVS